jgi:hypothetical protein
MEFMSILDVRKLTEFSWLRKETILEYMRACHNVHTPMHELCCLPFNTCTSAQALISPIGMLPSGCNMLYCMLNFVFSLTLTSQ